MEAARAAGATVPAALRPRIGHAAQLLAKDEDVETILAAARRLGEGGFEDLYTAVRAVKQERPMPTAVRTAHPAVRVADLPAEARSSSCIRLVYGTWPRAVIDAELWEDELGRVPERFLLAAVRAIAKDGGEWAPHWGKVYKVACDIGRPILAAERQERARVAELERIAARS